MKFLKALAVIAGIVAVFALPPLLAQIIISIPFLDIIVVAGSFGGLLYILNKLLSRLEK
jgi:hypothetical protein